MAEIGLLANVAQVIGAGLGLSTLLFDFASTLGSASDDVKSLATNVSLFCSVLGHVNTTLSRQQSSRLSLAAIQTADEVVKQCQIIFDELEAKIKNLRRGDQSLELMAKVKWYFQQKHILLVHEQLRTCSATLHLMLTTLILADKIAARRQSGVPPDDQEEQNRQLANSLYVAQQAAQERLVQLEEEVMHESSPRLTPFTTSPTSHSPSMLTPEGIQGEKLRHRRNRSSRIIDGAVVDYEQPRKRFSVLLDTHMNRLSLVHSFDPSQEGILDPRDVSNLQSDQLLTQWTEQEDPGPISPLPFATSVETANEDVLKGESQLDKPSAAAGEELLAEKNFKRFRVSLEDPCWKVIPAALRGYNIYTDWHEYELFIIAGKVERRLGLTEKPLVVFKQLFRDGKNPMFMLRKFSTVEKVLETETDAVTSAKSEF